jgi:ubiquinone/menaquinone biosynthesis C-methylase UbiE
MGYYLEQQEEVNAYFQSQATLWKDIYASDSLLSEIVRDRHAAVLDWIDSLALAPGSQVLEVGCGAGFMAVALAQRGLHVQAIDSVEAMVEQANQNAVETGTANLLSITVGDAHTLAFDDDFFDLVLAIGVIPWLAQPELAMREIARVTKPGGYAILATANRMALPSLLDPLYNPFLAPLRERLKRMLERVGLLHRPSDQSLSMTYHTCRFIDDYLARLALVKTRGMTRGFQFWFLRRQVLPDRLGIPLHRRLQRLVDRNIPGLRSLGLTYFVLARKSVARPLMPPTNTEEAACDATKVQ